MAIRFLNNTQVEELKNILGYYKHYYICNKCGSVYGSDNKEEITICATCINKLKERGKTRL